MYGFDPHKIHLNYDDKHCAPAAEEWFEHMSTVHDQIHDPLTRINQKCSNIHIEEAIQFYNDDWVLVDRRNLQVHA